MLRRLLVLFALCLFTSGAAHAIANVEIEVNDSATEIDDYLCWSPTKARVKLTNTEGTSVAVKVVSKSNGGGEIQFARNNGTSPAKPNLKIQTELDLTLSPDGTWASFYVLGTKASIGEKDISIEIKDAAGSVLASKRVMVRVRKNADKLTPQERDQFLSAVAQLHGLNRPVGHGQDFLKYAVIHDTAFNLGIHRADQGFPLFLAWHRAFLLSLERELQAIDPRVALPYWRFDMDNSNLFSLNFMGKVGGSQEADGTLVQFSNTNPINGWYTHDDGRLRRFNDGNESVTKFTWDGVRPMVRDLPTIFASSGADKYGGNLPRNGINARYEFTYHNGAHARIDGWLGSGSSPRDPLFFLLHSNVDRAWAEWQGKYSRFDKNSTDSYSLLGSYPGEEDLNRWIKSSYAEDGMWPWNLDDGSSTPSDLRDDWPSKGFSFPKSPAGFNPVGAPKPSDMIDYLNLLGGSEQLGMCYDDIAY